MERLETLPRVHPRDDALRGGGQSAVPRNVTDKALYQKVKDGIWREIRKSGKQNWGAYHSGMLVQVYKAKFRQRYGDKKSPYTGKKNDDLSRWYKEKWIDACQYPKIRPCGRRSARHGKIRYCRPLKRISDRTPKTVKELSPSIIRSRCKLKSSGKRVVAGRPRSRRAGKIQNKRGKKRATPRDPPPCSSVPRTHKKSSPSIRFKSKKCRRTADAKIFSLPRHHSPQECRKMFHKKTGGFTARASCAPFLVKLKGGGRKSLNIYGDPLEPCHVPTTTTEKEGQINPLDGSWDKEGKCTDKIHSVCVHEIPADFCNETKQEAHEGARTWCSEKKSEIPEHCICQAAYSLYVKGNDGTDATKKDLKIKCPAVSKDILNTLEEQIQNWRDPLEREEARAEAADTLNHLYQKCVGDNDGIAHEWICNKYKSLSLDTPVDPHPQPLESKCNPPSGGGKRRVKKLKGCRDEAPASSILRMPEVRGKLAEDVVRIEVSSRRNKKYTAVVKNRETGKERLIHFGHKDYPQYRDGTRVKAYASRDHCDAARRERYFQRHSSSIVDKRKATLHEFRKKARASKFYFNPKILSHLYLW